jgi:hypothetical protein
MKQIETEISLAKKYLNGDYTDVQLNYWVVQNKFDKQRIENLIDCLRMAEPFLVATKLIIAFILINYLLGFALSVIYFAQ